MAEGVFRHLTKFELPGASPLIKNVDSCGTGAYHEGDSPDPRTMSVLKAHGITSNQYRHAARKIRSSDFVDFDYIFAMDDDNKDYLERARNRLVKNGSLDESKAGKVMLFGAWGGKGEEEVGDPYYGASDGFDSAYEQVDRFSRAFLKALGESSSAEKE